MHHSFQWQLLLFWSVLFSSVCYGHGLSRVRTSGFGFVLSQKAISDGFDFCESHALVAVEVAARVPANDGSLDQDWELEKLYRKPHVLSCCEIDAIVCNRDGAFGDRVKSTITGQDVAGFDFVWLNYSPVAMRSLAQSYGLVPTEGADVADHRSVSSCRFEAALDKVENPASQPADEPQSKWTEDQRHYGQENISDDYEHSELDVCPASCFNQCTVRFLPLFVFAGNTFRTAVIGPFHVLHFPAEFECGGIGGFTVGKISNWRWCNIDRWTHVQDLGKGQRLHKLSNVEDALQQKRNTRLSFFVHQSLTTATQDATRHGLPFPCPRKRHGLLDDVDAPVQFVCERVFLLSELLAFDDESPGFIVFNESSESFSEARYVSRIGSAESINQIAQRVVLVEATATNPTSNVFCCHAHHDSPARVRKQGPSVPVLVSSAKTKRLAILKKGQYNSSYEVEGLNHRLTILGVQSGDSVSSLEMSGVDQRKVSQPHKLNVAGSSPVPATKLGWVAWCRRMSTNGLPEAAHETRPAFEGIG